VIVSEEVQEAMQGEDLVLGELGVARISRLTPRDASRDDDLAEKETGAGEGLRAKG
jgi:hypothetical protein